MGLLDLDWLSSALKVTGWRAAAIAAACAVIFFLRPFNIPDAWAWFFGAVGLIAAFIALAAIAESVWQWASAVDGAASSTT